MILQYPIGLSASNEELAFFNNEILARLGVPPATRSQVERDFSIVGSGSSTGTNFVAFRNFGRRFPGKPAATSPATCA